MNSQKKLTIKWGKETLAIETFASNIGELKSELAIKTNVVAERQKLLLKGKVLNESDGIPENALITLMGSADTNLVSNSKVVFMEDLTSEEKAKILRDKGEVLVYGLQNLGNTCYLNSTIQVLGRVPELRQAIKQFQIRGDNNMNDLLGKSLGIVYDQLDKASDTITPNRLFDALQRINPMFAEKDNGIPKQQDAEECYSLILNMIRELLPNSCEEKFSDKLIDELFGIQMDIKLVNVEVNTEIKQKKETIYKLPCFIESQTSELMSGLKASMKENIELYSDALGRNTFFEKQQLLSRLPPYLTVQFMRFFWKKENVSTGAKAGKAKILKSVLFSKVIEVYDLCNDETKELLNLGRGIETNMLKEDKNFRIDNVQPGPNMIPTGRYQLIALLTHQGRSSESGHYIGWVHKKDDVWIKYDDDKISYVNIADILELKGGGDWPMAYISIYKRLEIPFNQ
jgi:ubiquitin carboxyl-terminal hydrolase 14